MSFFVTYLQRRFTVGPLHLFVIDKHRRYVKQALETVGCCPNQEVTRSLENNPVCQDPRRLGPDQFPSFPFNLDSDPNLTSVNVCHLLVSVRRYRYQYTI